MRNESLPREVSDSVRAEIHALIEDFERCLTQSNSRKNARRRPDPTRQHIERRLTELVNARAR